MTTGRTGEHYSPTAHCRSIAQKTALRPRNKLLANKKRMEWAGNPGTNQFQMHWRGIPNILWPGLGHHYVQVEGV